MDNKAPDAFRTISEVADELDLPQHVLRFWESRFRDIKPMKRGGGRRYYRPDDVELLRGIRHLLYGEGYTIRGVQRILREQGAKFVQAVWLEGAAQPPHGASEDEDITDEAGSPNDGIVEESRGLRGRLTSLIGRDLSDRDAGEARREPPFKSAPVPRIEPADRAVHGADMAPAEPEPPMPAPEPVVSTAPSRADGRLVRDDLRKLHAVLHELAECRKLIKAAAFRAE
ncbi:MAG: MerR family transcriptional regulator [Deltaproteobacteria bacterium]|nr:MerR family transcriptional regulator [Deltaproteobacteria bacterium]